MPATLSADPELVIVDTDAGRTTGQTMISFDGDGFPAQIFKREFGKKLWDAQVDLKLAADNAGIDDPTLIEKFLKKGQFPSDKLKPGQVIQYGILVPGSERDFNPLKMEVEDGRLADIVTVFALLKRSGEPDWITDFNINTGGTFRHRNVVTANTETIVVMKVGRGVPFQDNYKMWQLNERDVEHKLTSPPGNVHSLQAVPLFPGHLYAATIRLSDRQGRWHTFPEFFSTLSRQVTLNFKMLKIVDCGDDTVGEANFIFQVLEGKNQSTYRVVKEFTKGSPDNPIDISDENGKDEMPLTFSHVIGPKEIYEDNRMIGVVAMGHEHDPAWEPDEYAGSKPTFLLVPEGMGKETVTSVKKIVSAPSTSGDEFRFTVVVEHSIDYV